MNTLAAPLRRTVRQATPPVLDTLARIFLALGRHYNTNSNQILVLRGDLDLLRLRAAVARAVQRYDHVLQRLDLPGQRWAADDVPVRQAHFNGDCTLRSEAFRDRLMALSDSHRIDWRHQPATQVFLVRSHDRRTCCVYLNSAHAAADAASDCMLVAEIAAQYGQPRSAAPAPAYAPLPVVAPAWFGTGARLRRWAAAWRDIAGAQMSRDRGLASPGGSRYGYGPEQAAAGFHTSVLEPAVVEQVRRAAKAHGVTLNTVFAAALLRLMAARAGEARALRLSLAVSLRGLLPAAGRDQAFGNHIITCTVRHAPAADAAADVRALHRAVDEVRQRRVPLELGRFELALPFMAAGALQPLTRRAMARAQVTNVCYSNPGVLPQDFSTFGSSTHPVLEYTGLGCLVSPYDLMFYTTTANGRTQLDALYRREAFAAIDDELFTPYREQLRRLVAELLTAASAAAASELPA